MKTTTTTNFQLVPTDKLIPYINNARTHSKEQIAKPSLFLKIITD